MLMFTVDVQLPEDFSTRAKARCHRAAGMAALKWFAEQRLRFRFGSSGVAAELGFEDRDEWYEDFKQERIPGTKGKPNLFSGRSQRVARGAMQRVTATRLALVLRGLSPGFARRRSSTLPDMLGELQRFTQAELNQMAEIYAETYAEILTAEINRATRRRRVV